MGVKIFSVERDFVRVPVGEGPEARLIVWPGVGARFGTFNYFTMKPGQEVKAHVHQASEDVFFIVQGEGIVRDLGAGVDHPVAKGSVVFVEPGTLHAVTCIGREQYIGVGSIFPPDLEMYRKAGLKW